MRQAKSRDVTGWYARLNAILTGHGLSGIAVPTVSGAARAAQVTPLTDKLEAMKTDTYYKYAAYSDWGQVVQGAMMRELTPVGVEATLSSIEAVIVCRNTAANNYGTCTNGTDSNGSHSNGSNGYGTCSNGTHSNGSNQNEANSYITCGKGSLSNLTQSNGTKTNGRYDDDPTGWADHSNGTNINGTHTNGLGNNSNVPYSNGSKSNGKNTDGSEVDVGNANSAKTN